MDFLKNSWDLTWKRYSSSKAYFYLSPSHHCLLPLLRLIEENIRGKCLDLGAGDLIYKQYLKTAADSYTSLDKEKTHPEIDVIGDALNLPFDDAEFDSIFCSQVLEHINEPEKAITEISRCLKKDGYLLLTVPHLSYLHGEPHDYYRFTDHGIEYLCNKHGLKVEKIIPLGGYLGFISTPFSILFLSLFNKIPLFNYLTFSINAVCSAFVSRIDMLLKTRIYAMNFGVVAKRESSALQQK